MKVDMGRHVFVIHDCEVYSPGGAHCAMVRARKRNLAQKIDLVAKCREDEWRVWLYLVEVGATQHAFLRALGSRQPEHIIQKVYQKR